MIIYLVIGLLGGVLGEICFGLRIRVRISRLAGGGFGRLGWSFLNFVIWVVYCWG